MSALAEPVSPEDHARAILPLAEGRARRLAREVGLPADEAYSAALLGLAVALDRFDPARGPFVPFALRKIDGYIRNAGRSWRWRGEAQQQPGRELAGDVDQVLATIPDQLYTHDLADQRTDLHRALSALTQQERQVVFLRARCDQTFPQIARNLGMDERHCRYLWHRALDQLRNGILGDQPADRTR